MSIAKEVDFVTGVTPISEEFLEVLQELLAGYVSPNFRLEELNPTTVQIPAGNDHDSVGIAVGGQMRRRDTAVSVNVTGGAGSRNIYVTADTADHLFGLEVVVGASAATLSRKVGELEWSGTTITEIRQFVGDLSSHDDLWGVSANDHHNENHASRHAPGGADPMASLEVDNEAFDTNSTALTGSFTTIDSVTLTIPADWASWKATVWVKAELQGTGAASDTGEFRMVIDGANEETHRQIISSWGTLSLIARRTGVITTGVRTISLQARETSGGLAIADIFLYARAVRTG